MSGHARFRPLSFTETYMCREKLGMTDDELNAHLNTRPRAVIVGEAPGRSTRDDCAMFPWPPGSAGWRLYGMSGYQTPANYLRHFDRVNLLQWTDAIMSGAIRGWRGAAAREKAQRILHDLGKFDGDEVRLVLCGARVRDAFGVRAKWFTPVEVNVHPSVPRRWAVTVPHPSGRNRVLNDNPAARELTAAALAWAARLGTDEEYC